MESPLKYPDMRKNLISCLESLSDQNYQQTVWVEHKKTLKWDNLDEVVHFLYDDTSLNENASDYIGIALRDEHEAIEISGLTSLLDGIFDKYGLDKSDEFYINVPSWKMVVDKAAGILATMT